MIRHTAAVLAVLLVAACDPTHPGPKPPPPRPVAPATSRPAEPGTFCSPRGAQGHTAAGKAMVCGPSTTDSRNRWRAP